MCPGVISTMLLVLQWEGLFCAPVHATRAMAASDLIAAGFNMATKFELPCQGLKEEPYRKKVCAGMKPPNQDG